MRLFVVMVVLRMVVQLNMRPVSFQTKSKAFTSNVSCRKQHTASQGLGARAKRHSI